MLLEHADADEGLHLRGQLLLVTHDEHLSGILPCLALRNVQLVFEEGRDFSDVVGIEEGVDLVHHEDGRLDDLREAKYESQGSHRFLTAGEHLQVDTMALARRTEVKDYLRVERFVNSVGDEQVGRARRLRELSVVDWQLGADFVEEVEEFGLALLRDSLKVVSGSHKLLRR